MKFKKIAALFLALMLIFAFAACGTEPEQSEQPENSDTFDPEESLTSSESESSSEAELSPEELAKSVGYMTLEEITAAGYYPLWMQPNSYIVYDAEGKPTVTEGAYLTPEDLVGRDDIATIRFTSKTSDMAVKPDTKAEYDLHGFIRNIYFLWPDGSYNLSPYYDIQSAEITYYADSDEYEQEKGKTVSLEDSLRHSVFWLGENMKLPVKNSSEPMGFPRYKVVFNNCGVEYCICVDSQNICSYTFFGEGNYTYPMANDFYSRIASIFEEAQK